MEEEWIKLESFDRPHQAEIRKTILEQNNINAVVVNARDSLFLLGDYELYVRREDEKMAHAIIEEFHGLTKVDSFILSKPLENFREILVQREARRMEPVGNLPAYTSDPFPRGAARGKAYSHYRYQETRRSVHEG